MHPPPSTHRIDISDGGLSAPTGRYEKRLRDLAGIYGDRAAFDAAVAAEGDRVVYSVADVRPAAKAGDLIFGVTRMEPGRIGSEFFVTRGHIHALANRPETYRGEAGAGLMLLEAPDGAVRILEIGPEIICYVPPFWIHRSVNIGVGPLVMSFCYPSDSGQDYEVIARSGGMKVRILAEGAGWTAVTNPDHRPRTAVEIDAILATAD